jgi:hypothetical protein
LLLLLAIFGILRFVIRHRRGGGARPVGQAPPPAISGPQLQPLYGVYRVPLDDGEQRPRPAEAEEKPGPAETAKSGPAKAADPP